MNGWEAQRFTGCPTVNTKQGPVTVQSESSSSELTLPCVISLLVLTEPETVHTTAAGSCMHCTQTGHPDLTCQPVNWKCGASRYIGNGNMAGLKAVGVGQC